MKKTVIALAAVIAAVSGSAALAQTPISEYHGPVGAEPTFQHSVQHIQYLGGQDDQRFNEFNGPVVRQ